MCRYQHQMSAFRYHFLNSLAEGSKMRCHVPFFIRRNSELVVPSMHVHIVASPTLSDYVSLRILLLETSTLQPRTNCLACNEMRPFPLTHSSPTVSLPPTVCNEYPCSIPHHARANRGNRAWTHPALPDCLLCSTAESTDCLLALRYGRVRIGVSPSTLRCTFPTRPWSFKFGP